MTHKDAHFVGRIRLYTTEEGGRRSPVLLPQLRCMLEYKEELFDCVLLLDEVGSISPGYEGEVPIAILFSHYVMDRLQVGDRFRLRELRFIGEGEVVEIVRR